MMLKNSMLWESFEGNILNLYLIKNKITDRIGISVFKNMKLYTWEENSVNDFLLLLWSKFLCIYIANIIHE